MKALKLAAGVLAALMVVPSMRGDMTNIYLTGNFLQLPVSTNGQFITDTSGGKYNAAGTGGNGGVDFWIWGTPVYNYSVGVNGASYSNGTWLPTVTNTSSASSESAIITGNVVPGLLFTRNVSFGINAKTIKIVDVFQNTGSNTFANLVTLDSTDPDQDYPSQKDDYITANDVVSAIGNNDLVVAVGSLSGLSLGFGSESPLCIPSAAGFNNFDPYTFNVLVDPDGALSDIDINIAFNYGTLAPSEMKTVVWYILFDDSQADLISSYKILMAPVLQSAGEMAGTFTFTWSAVSGQNYQVQYSTNLVSTNWLNLGGSVNATNATMFSSDPIEDSQRFYRVILLQ
jgi:hypothetical protein